MQVCKYPSFKWDLVGCLGLNTKKNEIKTLQILQKGALQKKKKGRDMWVVGLTDILILWVVGLNSN